MLKDITKCLHFQICDYHDDHTRFQLVFVFGRVYQDTVTIANFGDVHSRFVEVGNGQHGCIHAFWVGEVSY